MLARENNFVPDHVAVLGALKRFLPARTSALVWIETHLERFLTSTFAPAKKVENQNSLCGAKRPSGPAGAAGFPSRSLLAFLGYCGRLIRVVAHGDIVLADRNA